MARELDVKLKRYPRGFVGPLLGSETIGVSSGSSVSNIEVAGTTLKVNSDNKKPNPGYDKVVTSLYQKYNSAHAGADKFTIMGRFEFREELLKRAKLLFSLDGQANTLSQFFKYQIENAKLSKNHVEALFQLKEYILKDRGGYRVVTLERLLTYPEDHELLSKDDRKKYLEVLAKQTDTLGICEAINKWVARPGGYEHLLSFLYLLFGEYETPSTE